MSSWYFVEYVVAYECRALLVQLAVVTSVFAVVDDIGVAVFDVRAFLLVQKRRQHITMCHIGTLA